MLGIKAAVTEGAVAEGAVVEAAGKSQVCCCRLSFGKDETLKQFGDCRCLKFHNLIRETAEHISQLLVKLLRKGKPRQPAQMVPYKP